MSAIAPRSAMSRHASAMAPAQRQARKGNFVRNFMADYIYQNLINGLMTLVKGLDVLEHF